MQFEFRPDKTIFWSDANTLIVADLHLEKGSFYAQSGQMLPPYDTAATLKSLQRAVHETGAKRLIALGDNFHDNDGVNRLTEENKRLLPDIETIWITGNHDPALDLSTASGDHIVDRFEDENFVFCHIASDQPVSDKIEVSGHFHPKATLRARGRRLSGPCFIRSKDRIILPSFGAYTGGMDITSPAIQSLFPGEYEIIICWKDKTYRLSKDRYLQNAA